MIIQGAVTTAKIYAKNLEATAVEQVKNLASQPWAKSGNIRIMPDAHAGAGCVIGTSMYVENEVDPQIVGVDIGCGVRALPFLPSKPLDLEKFDEYVKKRVPAGFAIKEEKDIKYSDRIITNSLVLKLHCFDSVNWDRAVASIGTLGGGNHFIAIEVDEHTGIHYLLIHTGSRNLGKQVADYYTNIAKQGNDKEELDAIIQQLKNEGRYKEISQAIAQYKKENVKDPSLLPTVKGQHFHDYMHDMNLAQEYAKINRQSICYVLSLHLIDQGATLYHSFDTVHNYIEMLGDGRGLVRKGAVSARHQECLIIPLNMRDGSLICLGKGNEEWNYTAPHGAGRLMSRAQARKTLNEEQLKIDMEGIYTTTANVSTIDEAPQAYKPAEEIKSLIEDTVEIVAHIKPIYNFKAS